MRLNTIGAIILGVVMVTAIPAATIAVPSAVGGGDAGATAGLDQPGGPGSMEDVEVTELDAPENATQGDVVEVEATVNNTGDEDVNGPIMYKFDGQNRGASPVNLAPGEEAQVSFELRTNGIEPGTYEHGVFAGEEGLTAEIEIEEGDRGEEPGPNLTVEFSNLTAPPNATQGEWIEVTADVNNTGDQRTVGPVKYKFNDSVRGASPVDLAPGESTEVAFDFKVNNGIEPGNYTHGVFAGDANATAEIEILEGEDEEDDNESSGELAPFQETTPLESNQTDPDNLAGKIRAESEYADNISVELVTDTEENSTLEITGPENATNVTFYLQQQALEASQDLDNVTVYLDGEEIEIYDDAGPGNSPWFAVEIDHFSTRTLSFVSESDNGSDDGNDGNDGNDGDSPPAVGEGPPQDLDGDGLSEDVDGDGEFTIGDVQALFENLDEPAVQDRADQFDFSGDNADVVTVGDVQALFFDLAE